MMRGRKMMFDKLHNAKKMYDSVEIPPELESIIELGL